ncbi:MULTISPECIES: carbohydrate ABC transporter permease [Paenibacillus]|uniref:Sugar ABC transporter permease n=3 Tax=Paenibacillus TaxID=44249 RepID=A0AAJ2JW96_9BACL|nr:MULTISPECIES: sugar ABC transporter permease [Paenibacillus]EPY11477.1 binding-protein-dependent transport systems inner membrane component [Paenibacillus alvei A6-6i-x]MCM3290943.1 sugar ABC transporter permease [Paenibacillus sp. MER 180]MCY9530001.1 sugar ABC transporter permease [Paenibacillus alvei]MDT8977552.1 sugar ABC transporter permease [Paenibacillus sp. chi10]OBY76711.1 sugar ABC transporter permease [Paenibacillus sp. KS1]
MKGKKSLGISARETLAGYMFVAPLMIGLMVLTLIPVVCSLLLSFTEWNFVAGYGAIKFVGFDNFIRLFQDDVFIQSLLNNLVFIITVPITLILSLLLSILIDKHVYFKDGFKVVYFLPYISSVVAVAMVWQVLFHPSLGPVNQLLMSFGIENPPKWLADIDYALPSLMMIQVWIMLGYNIIIYIAALQSIPKDLYEAADIDGAGTWVKFRQITVPNVSPTTFFLLVTGIIGSFKVFDLIQVLTQGGPANSTNVIVYDLYDTAFNQLKTGYASSMALILFLICLFITAGQWIAQKKWVNY